MKPPGTAYVRSLKGGGGGGYPVMGYVSPVIRIPRRGALILGHMLVLQEVGFGAGWGSCAFNTCVEGVKSSQLQV